MCSCHFTGFVGGNVYNKNGGGEFICLTSEPLWGTYDDSAALVSAQIFGAEYQFGEQGYANGGSEFFGQNLYDHDAPCAVCHTSRQATLMIPGRNECYPGWTKEYSGYLASEMTRTDRSSKNYICLDTHSEFETGDFENKNGAVMYLTEAQCGSLPCPPYVNNRELTCVVCTK